MVVSKQLLSESASTQNMQHSHPYFLVVGKEQIDIWRIDEASNTLRKHVRLSQFVPFPGFDRDPHEVYQMAPVIDIENGVVIIAQSCESAENRTSTLWVFSLGTGDVLRKTELQGCWRPYFLNYRKGRVIATLDQNEDEVPPEGRSRIVVCDTNSEIGVIGSVHLPNHLQPREAKREITGGGVLRCVYYAPNGDVIGTSAEAYEDTLDVLRWRAGDLPTFPQPDATVTLRATFEGCDRTYPFCSTTLDASSFLLAVSQEVAGLIPDGYHRQMILYAIDWTTMSVRWASDPLLGFVYDVWHVASHGIVVAAGEREMGGWSQFYIAILDPSTGERRLLEVIDETPQENTPKLWGLSEDRENPEVVVVFTDGSICVVPLADFAKNGFPRDGEHVRTEKPIPGTVQVEKREVVLGCRSVLLSAAAETGPCYLYYLHW